MKGWVIDASIAFAWVHPGQATPETANLLVEIENGATIIVPALWFAEVANGLLVLQRRKKITGKERKAALEKLDALNFIVDDDSSRAPFFETSILAEKHDLTVYDAVYLELALRRGLSLATRDDALRKAAVKAGVLVL